MSQAIISNPINRFSSCILVLVLTTLGILYYPVFVDLVYDWKVNDDYSHGFFIPVISCYLIYRMRHEIKAIGIQPANWGLLVVLAGLCQLYIASVGSEYFLKRTSLIVVLLGSSLFLFGKPITKKMLPPIGYLIFMIPLPAIIWNKIAFPMQLLSSEVTAEVVRFLGIPIFREGNILHLANMTLEVVNACSGLRSLVTMFALSGALAMLSNLDQWQKWILFFSSAPIAIIANTIRLSGTAVLASFYGPEVARGFLHDFSGVVVFILGLVFLQGVNKVLLKVAR